MKNILDRGELIWLDDLTMNRVSTFFTYNVLAVDVIIVSEWKKPGQLWLKGRIGWWPCMERIWNFVLDETFNQLNSMQKEAVKHWWGQFGDAQINSVFVDNDISAASLSTFKNLLTQDTISNIKTNMKLNNSKLKINPPVELFPNDESENWVIVLIELRTDVPGCEDQIFDLIEMLRSYKIVFWPKISS